MGSSPSIGSLFFKISGRYSSGQRGQPVKLLFLTSQVRILLSPPYLSGSSSVGRASAFQAECRRFEPGLPLNFSLMKNCIYIIIFLIIGHLSFSQSDDRTWIRGKVLYKNNSVIAANVVNNTSQQATITDDEGEFEIKVKMNDRLVFSSVQYQIRSIVID